jgi:hypothetical protein
MNQCRPLAATIRSIPHSTPELNIRCSADCTLIFGSVEEVDRTLFAPWATSRRCTLPERNASTNAEQPNAKVQPHAAPTQPSPLAATGRRMSAATQR